MGAKCFFFFLDYFALLDKHVFNRNDKIFPAPCEVLGLMIELWFEGEVAFLLFNLIQPCKFCLLSG